MKNRSTVPVLAALTVLAVLARPLSAATNLEVSGTVLVPQVKRFGMNLGVNTFYDDRQIMKSLVFRNPGFEAMLFQSVVRCGSGGTAGFVDDNPYALWPSGFWNGATYEVIWGAAKNRAGTIVSSAAPSGGTGTAYQLGDSGSALAPGDHLVLRKSVPGNATAGWWTYASGGAAATTELLDLPPGTEGRQAVRLSAGGGQFLQLSAYFNTVTGQNFVRLNGSYRLTFKAKGVGGANRLRLNVRRVTSSSSFLDQTITLAGSWADYAFDFNAAENGSETGAIQVQFGPVGSDLLLDDVSLVQTDGDPTNTTVFADWVVRALRGFRPGILRYQVLFHLGNTLDNELAPPLARLRSGYSAWGTTQDEIQYSLPEFLTLCELVGAEPWYVVPITVSPREMSNLIEFLSGPATSPYGARRAALGHPAPWTAVFPKIHLEFGNESWNGIYRGGTIADPVVYGNRGGEIFGAARSSPWYDAARTDLVLGGQASWTARTLAIHGASSNNDSLTLAPYIANNVDFWASNEELFGPLFAEPEALSATSTGYMRRTYDGVQSSSRPVALSVYEVNLSTAGGSISQPALDSFTASAGAGIAVADHMLMMLRELGARDQALFTIAGYSFRRPDGKTSLQWGVTRNNGTGERKRPQYLAVELANEALSGDMLAVARSGDDPTWYQAPMNDVQIDAAHFLQTYAFASGNRRSLIVFNLSRTGSLDVTFTGVNAPRGSVVSKRIAPASINDANEDTVSVSTTEQLLAGFDPARPLSLPPFSMTLLSWSADTTPPSVSITSPAEGSSVRGSVPVAVSAADASGVSRVDLYRDGTILIGSTTTAPYAFTWSTSTASPGPHTLQATAVDAFGNTGLSATVNVTVAAAADVTAPTATITSPLNGATVVRNASVTIGASASDDVAVTRVDFTLNGALKCSDTSAPFTCGWHVPARQGASYRLQAIAYDAAGNAGPSAVVTVTAR